MAVNKKIAVLGLDGLSQGYLNKLINHGVLTYTKHLVNSNHTTIYNLECFPPTTPPSWTTILTGVNPGKHGIFAFDYIEPDTLDHKLFNAIHLEHPRIHEMLSMLEIPSIMINPIPGYPLIPAKNSKIISHTIIVPKTQYYPKSRDMEKYCRKIDLALDIPNNIFSECKKSLIKSLNLVKAVLEIIDDMLQSSKWNLFWVNLQIPDIILHKCGFEIFTKTLKMERKLFNYIDRLVKIMDESSDFFVIVSDHGFSIYNKLIRINDILANKGFVKVVNEFSKVALREYKELKFEIMGKSISRTRNFMVKHVDKYLSKAFYISKWNLGVHVKDEEIVDEIIRVLSSVKGIKWIKTREKIYHGPYVNRAPKLILCPDFEGGYLQSDNKIVGKEYEEGLFKDHHPLGVLIVKSKDVVLKRKPKVMNTVVTPLIMYVLEMPLPKTSDGVDELKSILAEKPSAIRFKNYTPKWRILKKIVSTLK